MSLAFCLHEEPRPGECGCCPSLAGSLTVKQETEPLRFGASRLQSRLRLHRDHVPLWLPAHPRASRRRSFHLGLLLVQPER
jgi:hypothetical protein